MIKARRAYSIVFLCCFSIVVFSQSNLVPNPSFETYTTCPNTYDINFSIGWLNFGQTPDYFNSCANISTPQVGVPTNYVGNQYAKDGNGYAGIVAYYPGPTREFIAIALTQTLSIGTKYYVSAYISRADTSPYICSSNKFGFRFSTIPFSFTTSVPIDNFSHIHSNTIITDSLGWTKVSGSFVADSLYKYFIIGNFYDDINTSTSQCSHPLALAYYYVDQTCVSTDSMLCNVSTEIVSFKKARDFNIYPNPANNTLILENFLKNEKYEIINIMGTIVKQGFCNGNKNTIDVSDLSNGLYFVMIREKKTKLLISH